MTEGLKRIHGEDHLHFITSSCYRRRPYLDAPRRDLFVVVLEEARQRFEFVVVGYVVMPEQFHLLMSEPVRLDPSWVMKWIKFRVSRKVLGESAHTSRLRAGESESASKRDVWGTQDESVEAAAHTSRLRSGESEG
ncbi:MAG: transposase, partial [Terriglobales bacterium]